MKKVIWLVFVLCLYSITRLQAQTVSFSFSAAAQTTSGWINVHGDPAVATVTATSPSGISISSGSPANWAGYAGSSAADGYGATGGTFFPASVMVNNWWQYSGSGTLGQYNAAVPQLIISGLNLDSVYTIKMSSSSTTGFNTNPTRYTVIGAAVVGYQDVNTHNNTASGAVFINVAPNSSGQVSVYVNTVSGTDAADISGLQIISGRTTAPTPQVTITSPANNDILAEDGNIIINATASETSGTITKVEFYNDTTKLGESLSAPYSFTWVNPDEGHYRIIARAIDGTGNANSASIQISVESLNSFWSMTGNIAVNSDSFFLGTVDTSKLVIRTRNVPRMAIDSNGNVTIPLAHPSVFSIGGTVNDPVTHPAFRVYDNGDLVASTTMDRSVNTYDQTGLRYYAKQGILQIGASDRIDTTQSPIVYGIWPSSAVILNSDSANQIIGKLQNTVLAGDVNKIDSGVRTENAFIGSESSHFFTSAGSFIRSFMGGYGNQISAAVDACSITGHNEVISKPINSIILSGYNNTTADVSSASIIGGVTNQFGGWAQLVSGKYLVNRTPYGTTLGSNNVDFTSKSYTAFTGMGAPGIATYPLFALGNSSSADSSIRSNAITVLFNGRTQINSTGHTNNLVEADVTPKAALEVVSNNSGVLLPKLTNAQRNAIASGDLQNGLLLYNTDSSAFQFYNGSAWTSVGSGAGNSGRWQFAGGTVYDSVDNIAIGTGNPKGYKLAVNGDAIFTKIWVKLYNNWPDYVFRKDYNLMDLASLERYIETHRHLPGMVSQSEVKRDGIDIGNHQAVLLRKVEELTLYLIDENKKLRTQNERIEHQDERLEKQQQEIDELKKMIRNGK